MTNTKRPLSPHLQVYRLPLLALISITHRMTGVCLSMGVIIFPIILACTASGPEGYYCVQEHLAAWYGKAFLFLFSVGLNFHLLNGVRHLVWDTGYNLDVKGAERSAVILIVSAIALTAAVWAVACSYYGGVL